MSEGNIFWEDYYFRDIRGGGGIFNTANFFLLVCLKRVKIDPFVKKPQRCLMFASHVH